MLHGTWVPWMEQEFSHGTLVPWMELKFMELEFHNFFLTQFLENRVIGNQT